MKRPNKSQSKIREARQLYDMYDVLGVDRKQRVIVCPLPMHPHSNNTPSFSIYMDHGIQKFHCHGSCARMGDIVDLIGCLLITNYDDRNPEHVKRALTLLDAGYKISPPKQQVKQPGLVNTVWQDFTPPGPEVIEYARLRGLTPETLQKFRVGQSNMFNKTWMTMPAFHMGRLMGVKMRNLNPSGNHDRYMGLPGSIAGLFNANGVYYSTDAILIVKAEIPVMLLDQHQILACAPTGGEGSMDAELYSFMVWTRKRVLVADNDRDPKVRKKMDEALLKRAEMFHAEIRRPPEAHKDIDDWILADPSAIDAIKGWLA